MNKIIKAIKATGGTILAVSKNDVDLLTIESYTKTKRYLCDGRIDFDALAMREHMARGGWIATDMETDIIEQFFGSPQRGERWDIRSIPKSRQK